MSKWPKDFSKQDQVLFDALIELLAKDDEGEHWISVDRFGEDQMYYLANGWQRLHRNRLLAWERRGWVIPTDPDRDLFGASDEFVYMAGLEEDSNV